LLTDLERLDEAARPPHGRYSQVGLSRVSKKLKEVVKELDEDEAAGLAKVLQFENLPPLEKWPDPVVIPEPERLGVKPDGFELNFEDDAGKKRDKRKKLRYHNLVLVDPKHPAPTAKRD
jgi:hypothetical protein